MAGSSNISTVSQELIVLSMTVAMRVGALLIVVPAKIVEAIDVCQSPVCTTDIQVYFNSHSTYVIYYMYYTAMVIYV